MVNILAYIRQLEAALGRPWIEDDYIRTMNRVSQVYIDGVRVALDDQIRQEVVHLLGDNRSNYSDVRDILQNYYRLLLGAMPSMEEACVVLVQPSPHEVDNDDNIEDEEEMIRLIMEEEEEDDDDDDDENHEKRVEEETILSRLKMRDGDDDVRIDELDTDICCICLEDLHQQRKKKIAKLEFCNHEFHACCIVEWLRRGTNICPLCKALAICR